MIINGADGSWFPVDYRGAICWNVLATWFGGDEDPQDDGTTASGVYTRGQPNLKACSLPMDVGKALPSTRGAPFPKMPWGMKPPAVDVPAGAHVKVWRMDNPDKFLDGLPLIDNGPAKSASHCAIARIASRMKRVKQYRLDLDHDHPHKNFAHAIDLTVKAFLLLGGTRGDGVISVGFEVLP